MDPGAAPGGRLEQRRGGGAVGEDLLDLQVGGQGLGQEDGAVDDEGPLLQTRSAAPREAPQPLDAGVSSPERCLVQAEASLAALAALAVATRAAKASGSRTARSARTLRSTSTSATRSPAMNRL